MIVLNYAAIVVAAVVVFVVSAVYYIVFSRQRAELSAAAGRSRPPAWKVAVELARNVVLASVVAGLVSLLGITDWAGGLKLAFALWIGFPVILLSGSAIWENVPWKLAAIHSGDWLLKLLLIAIIVSVWH